MIRLIIIPFNKDSILNHKDLISSIQGIIGNNRCFKGSSTEKLYQELALESLQNRRWFRKFRVFHKIVKEQSPKYLFDLIPSNSNSCQTRNSQNLRFSLFKVRYDFWNGINWIRIFATLLHFQRLRKIF